MKLTILVKDTNSSGGRSPTLFRSDNGEFFIQGYAVDSSVEKEANVPNGERLVKVSKTFIDALNETIKK